MTKSGPQSRSPVSVPTLVATTVEKSPDSLALHTRDRFGQDQKWTYGQYYKDIRTVAKGEYDELDTNTNYMFQVLFLLACSLSIRLVFLVTTPQILDRL